MTLTLVLNAELDRKSGNEYNVKATCVVKSNMESENWIDIWREKYPDDKKYSWFKSTKAGHLASRIDFFLVSECLANKTSDVGIVPSINTDHSMITYEVEISETPRGPGIWKINNKILQDEKFVTENEHLVTGRD